jgi:hypothetical protein
MGINVVESEEAETEEATEEARVESGAKALRKLKHPSRSRILRTFLNN